MDRFLLLNNANKKLERKLNVQIREYLTYTKNYMIVMKPDSCKVRQLDGHSSYFLCDLLLCVENEKLLGLRHGAEFQCSKEFLSINLSKFVIKTNINMFKTKLFHPRKLDFTK